MFANWISENNIKYYEIKEFKDGKELASGRLGRVYHATRNNGSKSYLLKEIFNINDIVVEELINDLEIRRKFNAHINVLKFCGFTKSEPVNGYYILVMEYADSGTIRQYLDANFGKLTWEDKYHLATQLVSVISDLHDEEIIMHGYLNPSTILVHQKTIKTKFFKKVNKITEEFQLDHSIYPYTDPKIFKINVSSQLDKKSDVYSVGVLLWEISSGKPPFEGNYTIGLAMEILGGRREQIIPNTPDYYSKIYTECWDDEPDKRPSMCDVKAIFDAQVTERQC